MHRLNRPALPSQWRQAMEQFMGEYPSNTQMRTENARWELFKNEQQEAYKAIRSILEQNQQGLCAFCETALSDTNRQIEHFIPKYLTTSGYEWTINFANYVMSCKGNENKFNETYSDDPSHLANLTCGAKKGDIDPRGKICNPYDDLPEEPIFRIEHQENGIKYAPDEDTCRRHNIDPALVASTIEHLGLNCPNLMRRRKNAWSDLMQRENEIYSDPLQNQIDNKINEFKNDELSPVNGRLPNFITLRKLFFIQ